MTDREKLIARLNASFEMQYSKRGMLTAPHTADDLISFGVIFARDTNVPSWIPVSERLPDSQADVLVVAFWHEKWQTMIGWYSDFGKKWRVVTPHGEFEPGGVTHWMPLPEPPKED